MSVQPDDRRARTYVPPTLSDHGSVLSLTGMPGGSVGCEGASGKQQRVDTGNDVGGGCDNAPENSPGG